MRRQAQELRQAIERLEQDTSGQQSLRAQPRRGAIQGGLAGIARQQAGVDAAARLAELRQQYAELTAEITRQEQAVSELPAPGTQARFVVPEGHVATVGQKIGLQAEQ